MGDEEKGTEEEPESNVGSEEAPAPGSTLPEEEQNGEEDNDDE